MASVEKRCRHPREEWSSCGCAWYLRRRDGGRVVYTNLGSDHAAAERVAQRLLGDHDLTVAELVDEWLALKEGAPGARPNSIAAYRGRAGHVKAWFGTMAVRHVRGRDMEAFAQDLLATGRAPATVQGAYAVLTSSLRLAVRKGVIRDVPRPVDGPGIPSPRAREFDLTLRQVEEVISRMPGVWGRVAELVLLTGLRWGEVVAIRPEDVDGDVLVVVRTRNRHGGVNPPKTRAGRRAVPLSPRAVEVLAGLDLPVGGDYRRAREALVHALGPLHQPGMGWHTLRNAHATLLDQARLSLREAGARMGHGHNFAQTLAYGLRGEAGDARGLDAVRRRHGGPSGGAAGSGGVARLDDARRRRRGS